MRAILAPPPARAVAPAPPPTFSVVIAAYQAARFIGEAVESVLAQTRPALELVVCDDGSTDDLDAALAPYRERLVLVRQENRGPGAAKMTAARLTSGDFVVLLDADDRFLPRRLEELARAAAARPDLDILATNALVEVDGRAVRRAYDETWSFEVEDQRRAILERCFILAHAAVRREPFLAVGGFDSDRSLLDDWDLWMRMILSGSRAGLVTEPLSVYRVREGSLSTQRAAILRGGVRCLERAAARTDLDREERATVGRTLRRWRCDLELVEAKAALGAGERGVRRRLARIALGRGYAPGTRAKAAISALVPSLAGTALGRRDNSFWVGAGGVRVERADASPTPE